MGSPPNWPYSSSYTRLKMGLWSQPTPLWRFSVRPSSCLEMHMTLIFSNSSVSVFDTR